MTLVQISPIKIDPWSSIIKFIGKTINADVMKELEKVKQEARETREKLEDRINVDDERYADTHRSRILRFNTELLRDQKHTEEDFIEVMAEIDDYKRFCHGHQDYKNNRAVHAIANIERVYDERLEKHDFL
jgi:hypothetical protein